MKPGRFFPFIVSVILALGKLYAQNDFYDTEIVREIRIAFEQSDWDYILDSLFTATGEERLTATLTVDGTVLDSVGIRYKGYSSVNTDRIKNPLNIKLDHIIANQEYMGVNKIKLSNVIHDPAFIREVLSYRVARQYMPASKANFANVYINDSLIGLYTNVEAVNKDFSCVHFGSRENSFFKGNPAELDYPYGSNSNLQYYDDDTASYFPYYTIESESGWGDLLALIRALDQDPDSIENILYIDRTLWMHALNYTLVNLDSYIA
ncbi:MAG: CotH kinase family protein, partial [Bacteroidetes bacterium]|nr:CotH kinase family protein [Bacteroidota bacterium]